MVKHRKFGKKKPNLFFEVGRICSINYGPDNGKICVILDFVDTTRALIDGPKSETGVARQTIPFKRLSITPIKIKCNKALPTGKLIKIFKESKVLEKWEKLPWAKKKKRNEIRANLTDFERFKVMVLKKKRSEIIRREVQELKKRHFYPKAFPLSKKKLFWKAKREGKEVEYPKTKKRDVKHTIAHKTGKRKRTRTRSKIRSKKKSVAKIEKYKAYCKAKRTIRRVGAKKLTPEQKLALKKKPRPKKEKLSKNPKIAARQKQLRKATRRKAKRKIKLDRRAKQRSKKKAYREYKEKQRAANKLAKEKGVFVSKRKNKKVAE